jgi:hypothetical protein
VKETYKSKRKSNAPEDMLIFKGAHPAIVNEETWNVVQRLRDTRRRPVRFTDEPNPLTGVLFCADCNHKMYFKRGNTGRPNQPHQEYCCSSYRHYSRSCTCHYIRVSVVESLILDAIRNVSGYVRENEARFIQRVREESVIQKEAAVRDSRKKLTHATRRRDEIGGLIKKLYESYAAGMIPEKHFSDLLSGYDAEQTKLDGDVLRLQAEIDSYHADTVRADKFIELVRRHTGFTEFSAALLNEFVERVIVHEAVKSNGIRTQDIEIYFAFIGKFDVPGATQTHIPEERPAPLYPKKLRHLMTEEELAHARKIDHRRYKEKIAPRIAQEQAVRAEILKGTSFEEAI